MKCDITIFKLEKDQKCVWKPFGFDAVNGKFTQKWRWDVCKELSALVGFNVMPSDDCKRSILDQLSAEVGFDFCGLLSNCKQSSDVVRFYFSDSDLEIHVNNKEVVYHIHIKEHQEICD